MGRGRNNSLNQYRDTILQITYHLLVLTTHLLQVSFTTVFIQPATISIFLSNFCTNVYFQLVDHVSYLTHILNPHILLCQFTIFYFCVLYLSYIQLLKSITPSLSPLRHWTSKPYKKNLTSIMQTIFTTFIGVSAVSSESSSSRKSTIVRDFSFSSLSNFQNVNLLNKSQIPRSKVIHVLYLLIRIDIS